MIIDLNYYLSYNVETNSSGENSMKNEDLHNNIIEPDVEHDLIQEGEGLPREIIAEIFSYLDQTSQSQLALSHSMFGLSQGDRIKIKLMDYISKGKLDKINSLFEIRPEFCNEDTFFKLAGFARLNPMEKILQKKPELFYTQHPLTDASGRFFKKITAFQYAVWAADAHPSMLNMMLDCMEKHEDAESIRLELLRQYKEFMEKDIPYTLNGKKYQDKQFSLQPLMDALTVYIGKCDTWTTEERGLFWDEKIGTHIALFPGQRLLQYVDPVARHNSVKYKGDYVTGPGQDKGLSISCHPALYWGKEHAMLLLKDLTKLSEIRKSDMEMFVQRLQTPVVNKEISKSWCSIS